MSEKNEVSSVDVIGEEITMSSMSGSKTLNIYPQVLGINIYQSIDSSTQTAEIYVADGIDMYDRFPIVGEEEVSFAIMTPGSNEPREYRFFVHAVNDSQIGSNDNMRYYVLRCVTRDFLISMSGRFTQKFNEDYDQAVETILRERIGTEKILRREKTKGIFDMMLSNVRPFQAIDLVRQRAVSSTHASSLFFFFEDHDGYNFTTIENLFRSRKKSTGDFEFFFDPAHQVSLREINVRNVLAFYNPTMGNNVSKIRDAGLNSLTRSYDVLTGQVNEYDFISSRDFKLIETVDTTKSYDMNSSHYLKTFGSKPSKRFLTFKDTSRPENYFDGTISFKNAFREKMNQYTMMMRVYGDTEITVGDVIKVNVPSVTGETSSKTLSNYVSENYLITSLRHMLERDENGQFEHFMVFEMIKGSFLERV